MAAVSAAAIEAGLKRPFMCRSEKKTYSESMKSSLSPRRCILSLLLGAGLLLTAPARADTEQDRARDAVRAGQIMPLDRVLARVRQTWPGEVLEVELEQKHGLWVYDIRLLQPDGQLRKLRLDARDAAPLKDRLRWRERRGGDEGRHRGGDGT